MGLEHVPATGVALQSHRDALLAGPLRQAQAVVAQQFVLADLYQQRRQPRQVGMQRRQGGRAWLRVGRQQQAHRAFQPGPRQQRVAGLRRVQALAAEVGPGREQQQPGRQRQAARLQLQGQGQRQVAARRVAGEQQLARRMAGLQQCQVDRQGVVAGGGERMFRGTSVVHCANLGGAAPGQVRGDRPVGRRRADQVGAAVQVEHPAPRLHPARPQPLAGHAGEAAALANDAAGAQRRQAQPAQHAALQRHWHGRTDQPAEQQAQAAAQETGAQALRRRHQGRFSGPGHSRQAPAGAYASDRRRCSPASCWCSCRRQSCTSCRSHAPRRYGATPVAPPG